MLVGEKGLFWMDTATAGVTRYVKLLEWGSAKPRVVVASNVTVKALWASGATLYWSAGDGPHDGTLKRTPLDDSTATTTDLWSGGPAPQAISGDATFVYWVGVVEHGLGAVWRACR